MGTRKPDKSTGKKTPPGQPQSPGKSLNAKDLKDVTGGFVLKEQPEKIPDIQTIKVKLVDSDLTSDPYKN